MGKIIEFGRQLALPLKWYEVDYSHGGVITTISRPVEDIALENLARQASIMKAHGTPEFCELDWIVYFKDLELQFKYKNSINIQVQEVAKALDMDTESVEKVLRRVDAIMELRDLMGLVALPPIPMQYVGVNKRVQKIRRAA